MADYVMTVDSDTEEPLNASKGPTDDLNPEFVFDLTGDAYNELLDGTGEPQDEIKIGSKPEPISVDDIIARRKLSAKRKRAVEDVDASDDDDLSLGGDEDESEEEAEGSEAGDELDDSEEEEDPLATSDEEDGVDSQEDAEDAVAYGMSGSEGDSDEDEETQAEKDRKTAFFDAEMPSTDKHSSFLSMNLSRPILKSLTTLGFQKPTPIQAATIPVALLGKDVVGGAVTGSGKTAAFTIPMIERLLYREKGKKASATRCLVLVPTRELAVQCYEVSTKLAAHTDIQFCLIVGGLSIKSQEAALRTRPDVVIATPGRLIDHIHNSLSFTLDTLDVLVLDEADRMLSDGFADELAEIIKSCPVSRQTMLFSATMTDSVDDLVKMSLQKPVRIFVDPKRSTARGLVQEFVRVRTGKEADRSAILVALCKRSFKSNTIIFLRSKKLAHQIRIVFSLLGMKCDELHGDLTQEQRMKALQQFKDGNVDYLMATDLASRGLDIKGIETVINYDMPGQLAQYLHRVGRTARAGTKGRSVTLVGEADRKMLKAAVKHGASADQIRHRIVPVETINKWSEKLEHMKDEISAIMQEEKEEKQFRQAEMEVKKGQNMIEHETEIYSRPARTWFQTSKEKEAAEALSKQQHETGPRALKKLKEAEATKPKRDKFSGLSRKLKRRKLAMEEDEELGSGKVIAASIRSAKKAARPKPIGVPDKKLPKKDAKSKGKKRKVISKGGSFDKDLGQRKSSSGGGGSREGVRAKKGDAIGGMHKKGKQKGKP